MSDFKSTLIDDLKSIHEKTASGDRYKKLNLSINPFPAAAIAQFAHFEPVDDQIKEKIKSFISQTYKKVDNDNQIGDYAGLSIVGEYGFGKTHLMKYIEYLIKELSISEGLDFKALTVFVDKPDDEPRNIVHKVVEDLEPDNLRRLIWYCIHPKLLENRQQFIESHFANVVFKDNEPFFDELFKVPVLSNPLNFYSTFKSKGGNVKILQEKSKEVVSSEIVDDPSLIERYIGLIFPEKKSEANWDVLSGYVSSKDIQNKEVKFLNSIIAILRKNGYNMLYVFIDEFEDLGKLKGAKLTNYITTLNTMINRQRKWSVIVSLTQETLRAIKKESPPLYDRIATFELRLKPLAKDTAKKLISRYVEFGTAHGNSTALFSDELIDKMVTETEGNYRSFIRLSNQIVETAAEQKLNAPIQPSILDSISN